MGGRPPSLRARAFADTVADHAIPGVGRDCRYQPEKVFVHMQIEDPEVTRQALELLEKEGSCIIPNDQVRRAGVPSRPSRRLPPPRTLPRTLPRTS